jgi:phosphohistidine phosphatase
VSYLLYLMRHAIAEPRGETADIDRTLAAEGVRRMHRIALGLKRLGIVPDLILTSPLRRAEETAGILVPVLAPALPIEIYPPLAPGNPIPEVIGGLRAYRRAHHVVLVGHQPDLGQLASQLLTGSPSMLPLPFKKGSAAAIEVTALPPRAAGRLNWFLTPKQLRLMARSKRSHP